MSTLPAQPRIYHIVHVDKLSSIIADGGLWCDAKIASEGRPGTTIGMSNIKQRRLAELRVGCWPDDFVAEYVPFYFSPRSVMLYLIHRKNSELSFQGGQGEIIHLEADLAETVAWATERERRWAFSLPNAGAYGAEFLNDVSRLDQIDWNAVAATDWAAAAVKRAKQAEFLIKRKMPWSLFRRIGVLSRPVAQRVADAMANVAHRPEVRLMPAWYY